MPTCRLGALVAPLVIAGWTGQAPIPDAIAARPERQVQVLKATETVLTEIGDSDQFETLRISPDGKHIAIVRTQSEGEVVVVDGIPGKQYASIVGDSLRFSPDGKHTTYVAAPAGTVLKALDGAVATERYHAVWAASGGDGLVLVWDGHETTRYSAIDANSIAISADGTRYGFIAKRGGRWVVVVDGIAANTPYDDIAPYLVAPTLHFSPDGKRLAYVALRREADPSPLGYRFGWFVVDNDVKGPEFEKIAGGSLRLSPDGKHLGYIANRNGKPRLVVDGVEGKAYENIVWRSNYDTPFVFSPDGKRVAYVAATGRKNDYIPVVDGKEGKKSRGVAGLTFSPDSRHVAFITGEKEPIPGALTDMAVVVDDVAGRKQFQILPHVVFSPDSRRIAYVTLPERRRSEVAKASVVVDDREGALYREILRPVVFSPDSKHVAYRALSRESDSRIVVDGAEYTGRFQFVASAPLVFDGDTRLTTFALRANRLIRIDIALGASEP